MTSRSGLGPAVDFELDRVAFIAKKRRLHVAVDAYEVDRPGSAIFADFGRGRTDLIVRTTRPPSVVELHTMRLAMADAEVALPRLLMGLYHALSFEPPLHPSEWDRIIDKNLDGCVDSTCRDVGPPPAALAEASSC